MLASVELNNFQAHEKLIVDFTDGINILTGPSQIGKSCIRRAIEWCLGFNNNIDGVRREGTKITSVKITKTDGIVIERVRSASINRFVLTKDGHVQVFDSVGKTTPQEVKDAIGINPIEVDGEELWLNSSPQIALPFLFDKSPTWRMKLFNKLTGNDLLDKLFVQFNKDILKINRDHKSDTERVEKLSVQLEEKEVEKEQLEAIHGIVKEQIEKLREKQKEYDNLLKLLELYQSNESALKDVKAKKSAIKYPQDAEIKELTIKSGVYELTTELLNSVVKNESEISRVSSELSAIVLPELNSEAVDTKIGTLDMLKTVIKRQDEANIRENDILEKIANVDFEIKDQIKALDELIESTDVCPLCSQNMNEECKHQLKEV